ncbi:hypothetical protein BO94DRAFT_326795 [Aspergillus sclerotioniger CBS 115572]|uniref:BZIP domain-containing protein n=1 Tax=Aspergillus sclerotioniger CBS 115572 TaxID=1450535 RepID=A0A317X6T3_9EURO|nr:hypothetical protein BO94DRAFT_326795 [Aspergillus sclerotioniger CBS 115572]PWY94279.1 hypothetical protein BO94DRAFT_326795 [Aspergillus sclerotioniger CBS 115572]
MAEQASFGQPGVSGGISATASQFTATNSFVAADYLTMPLAEENNLWTYSAMPQSMPSWPGKNESQAFPNSALEQSLKNSHVRNGQPTPPPVDGMYQISQYDQYNDSTYANPTPRGSFSQQARPGGEGPAPKRRRTNTMKSASPETDDLDLNLDLDRMKRQKFLERNRVAASKCRQKKKLHTERLQARHDELASKRDELDILVEKLRTELLNLKNELLTHAGCADEAISVHLSHMVKNITSRDTAAAEMRPDQLEALTMGSANMAPRSQTQSFGFDTPLQVQSRTDSLAVTPRRDSEHSLLTDGSYSFTDDAFEELIDA